MNTLLGKTLLWFLGTAVLTMMAIMGAAALNFNSGGQRPGLFGTFVALQFLEARTSFEAGGKAELKKTMDRIHSVTQGESFITDSAGHDLLSGEDRSDLTKYVEPTSIFPQVRRNRSIITRQSPDGKYWYVLIVNRGKWFTSFVRPEHALLILAVLVFLCYAFARHLTKPVRQLQLAVDRFGRGDLTARVGLQRRDELGQLATTFDQMADRTQTLLAAERRLLLDISHELRSPLARLSVAVELARSGDDAESHLNRIQKEADRLNSLVGELLQVTRAEGDPSQRKLDPVRLDTLVEEVVDDCVIEAEARGCHVELKEKKSVTLAGDAELLRRAVENVVRNAVRYSPAGTTVEVCVNSTAGESAVTVRDFGPGVPDEALARIFDPFYRVGTDRNRNSGGVGLGLAIAKRAVELHKGRLWAVNAAPGLMVKMEMPLGAGVVTSPALSRSLAS
ncbi:MAG: ATP-binding protein [Bryobacteraceae bacterium]